MGKKSRLKRERKVDVRMEEPRVRAGGERALHTRGDAPTAPTAKGMLKAAGFTEEMGHAYVKILMGIERDRPEPPKRLESMTPYEMRAWRDAVTAEYAKLGLDEWDVFGVKISARDMLLEAFRTKLVREKELDELLKNCDTHDGRLKLIEELESRRAQAESARIESIQKAKIARPAKFGLVKEAVAAEQNDLLMPARVLEETSKVHPDIWRHLDGVKADPARVGLQGWDSCCYMPYLVAFPVMEHIHRDTVAQSEAHLALASDSKLVAALCAWRMTKGVYRFDPTMMSELMRSEIDGDIPTSVFLRMPEWCVYIPTPGLEYSPGMPVHGMFSWIDIDPMRVGSDPSLCFEILLDPKRMSNQTLMGMAGGSRWRLERAQQRWVEQGEPVPTEEKAVELHFGGDEFVHFSVRVDLALGSMKDAVKRTVYEKHEKAKDLREFLNSAESRDMSEQQRLVTENYVDAMLNISDEAREGLAKGVSTFFMKAVNLVLYLCSDDADMTREGLEDRKAKVAKDLSLGRRVYQADKIKTWDVGMRLGSEIRGWMKQEDSGDRAGPEGVGESPRPHVRRAHWHTFLVGPRSGGQQRRPKWLPPIPVNVNTPDDLITTVHPVS